MYYLNLNICALDSERYPERVRAGVLLRHQRGQPLPVLQQPLRSGKFFSCLFKIWKNCNFSPYSQKMQFKILEQFLKCLKKECKFLKKANQTLTTHVHCTATVLIFILLKYMKIISIWLLQHNWTNNYF